MVKTPYQCDIVLIAPADQPDDERLQAAAWESLDFVNSFLHETLGLILPRGEWFYLRDTERTSADYAPDLWTPAWQVCAEQGVPLNAPGRLRICYVQTDQDDANFGGAASTPEEEPWGAVVRPGGDLRALACAPGYSWQEDTLTPNEKAEQFRLKLAALIHEVGHALGLGHPDGQDGGYPTDPILCARNQRSVMGNWWLWQSDCSGCTWNLDEMDTLRRSPFLVPADAPVSDEEAA